MLNNSSYNYFIDKTYDDYYYNDNNYKDNNYNDLNYNNYYKFYLKFNYVLTVCH